MNRAYVLDAALRAGGGDLRPYAEAMDVLERRLNQPPFTRMPAGCLNFALIELLARRMIAANGNSEERAFRKLIGVWGTLHPPVGAERIAGKVGEGALAS